MTTPIKVNDKFTVAGQPAKEEIEKLAKEGYKSVVNLRMENEADQPISPSEEEKLVKAAGMEYLHVPCDAKKMTAEQVDQIRASFEKLPKPIYVHCRSRLRAGACVISQLAIENNISGEGALMFAERMGFACDIPELKEFTTEYINTHLKKS